MFFECSKKKTPSTPSTPSTPIKSHYSHGFSLSSSSTKPTTFFFETNGLPNETKPFYLFLAQSWPNPKKSIHQVAPDFGASLPFFLLVFNNVSCACAALFVPKDRAVWRWRFEDKPATFVACRPFESSE